MEIIEVRQEQIIQLMRSTLGLPTSNSNVLDEALISSCVRRVAGFLCPCSISTLVSELLYSLKYLANEDDLRSRIEDIIDKLIIVGDLLELSDVSTNDVNAKGTWIFAAPPSFVVRPNGTILIFGITPDENSPVVSLSNRISYDGFRRLITPELGENLMAILKELGLVHLSEKTWLKLPKQNSPERLLDEMNKRLANCNPSGDVQDLLILASERPTNYYRNRWAVPSDHHGHFIARRPQVYGASIWCYAELQHGIVKRFLDIPFHEGGIKQRGCDGAWHLQMAIDWKRNNPQQYRVRDTEDGKIIDFFSPIPLWAERRLIAVGNTIESKGCLFSYSISQEGFANEEHFLKEYLWLHRK